MASNIQRSSVFCYSISHIYMAKDKLLLVSGIEAIGDDLSWIGLQWKASPKMGGLAILQRKLLTVGRISPMEIMEITAVGLGGSPWSSTIVMSWKKETNVCWLSNEVNYKLVLSSPNGRIRYDCSCCPCPDCPVSDYYIDMYDVSIPHGKCLPCYRSSHVVSMYKWFMPRLFLTIWNGGANRANRAVSCCAFISKSC